MYSLDNTETLIFSQKLEKIVHAVYGRNLGSESILLVQFLVLIFVVKYTTTTTTTTTTSTSELCDSVFPNTRRTSHKATSTVKYKSQRQRQ
jgi:hypothetical protein